MHAVVVKVSIKDADAAQKSLEEQVVPRVKQAPGFVAGYWTRSDDRSNGQGMMVFESEDAARAAADQLRANVPDPVTLESAEVREVVANAQAGEVCEHWSQLAHQILEVGSRGRSASRRLVALLQWACDGPQQSMGPPPTDVPAVWGKPGGDVIEAEGEATLIVGPDGVGKTTLVQQRTLMTSTRLAAELRGVLFE